MAVSATSVVEDAAKAHELAIANGQAIRWDTGTVNLLARIEKGVGVITLNKPERRNALGDDLSPFLRATLRAFATDGRVRCVLLTGAGNAFCSGGNVASMASGVGLEAEAPPPVVARTDWTGLPLGDAEGMDQFTKQATLTGVLWAMDKPTIAALPGAAAGAGLSIALAADVRVMARSAFATTAFRNVGLPGDYGASWLLPQLVGPAKAKQLLFTAARVGSEECLRLGIAQEVFDDSTVHTQAFELAASIAAGPRHAMRIFKQNVNDAADGNTFREGLDNEARRMAAFFRNDEAVADFREAAQAFVEKRKPQFK